jgi:hypothetical protein
MQHSSLTFFAEETVGEAELAGAAIRVAATVAGKQLLPPVRLGRLRPVVRKAASAPEQGRHGFEQVGQRVQELRVWRKGRDSDRQWQHFVLLQE